MRLKLCLQLSLVCCTALLTGGLVPFVEAGDNIEVWTAWPEQETPPPGVIRDRFWPNWSFPLVWVLPEVGVISNLQENTIPNEQVMTILDNAFLAWQQVQISDIGVEPGAEIGMEEHDGKARLDLVNIVTWSDDDPFVGNGAPAKGITWSYVGPLVTIPSGQSWENTQKNINYLKNEMVKNPSSDFELPPVDDTRKLEPGTILDMDMVLNKYYKWVDSPNDLLSEWDIRSTAVHEAGHLLGFAHSSLAFGSDNPVTMFPQNLPDNMDWQNNRADLAEDDIAQAGRQYPNYHPDTGFSATTGAISGHVAKPDGDPVRGVRVWAYKSSKTVQPMYETFTLTEWDERVKTGNAAAGDYLLNGMEPGHYYVCILDWGNKVPEIKETDYYGPLYYDNPIQYTINAYYGNGYTAKSGPGTTFSTEFYDDIQSSTDEPEFQNEHRFRKVEVRAGHTTPGIDFVTGRQATDFILVMDRSGSMAMPSGTEGKTKLKALQDAAQIFVDYLELLHISPPRLGLVQFKEELVPFVPAFDLQVLSTNNVEDAHQAIESMVAGGRTNISAGVLEGVDQLTEISNPHQRQIILLFSDGRHNYPVGSNLRDLIHDQVVDNDITFYSVGFGTDVSREVLSEVAENTGGLHVEEQGLQEGPLRKHFLSIAASSADQTIISDPHYTLASGETAELDVEVTSDDRDITVVVHWKTRDSKRMDVTITTPGKCEIKASSSGAGCDVRSGDTYRIVRIGLPFSCQSEKLREGTWTISATPAKEKIDKEEVEILVFGNSRTGLFAETFMSRQGPVVTGRLVRNGRVLRGGKMKAELLRPLPATYNSAILDVTGPINPGRYRKPDPKERRLSRFVLYDDGTHGDVRASDGVFSGLVPVGELGVYRVRLLATHIARQRSQPITREQWISFYFNGRWIIGGRKSEIRTPWN